MNSLKKGPEFCDISHCIKSAIRGRCKVHLVTVWHSDRYTQKNIWTDKSLRIGLQHKHASSVVWLSVDLVIVVMFVMWIDKHNLYVCLTLIVCYFINLSELLQWKMILWKSSWNNYKGFSPIEKGIILLSIKISFEQYDWVCIFYIWYQQLLYHWIILN